VRGALAEQGKFDEALQMFEEALEMLTRALGIDHDRCAATHFCIAQARAECGDMAGALESARERVRIYNKLGITNKDAAVAAVVLRRLEVKV
jgi:tetratricopeptide (TPR) repeat protein